MRWYSWMFVLAFPGFALAQTAAEPSFCQACKEYESFPKRLWKAYHEEFFPAEKNGEEEQEPARRGMPAPFNSPPFPSSDYLMVRTVGLPNDETFPLMKAIYDGPNGQAWKDSRIKIYGWVDASANWSTSSTNNLPNAFNIRANRPIELQQAILRFERYPDTVQTDHMDWGFKIDNLYGLDYRYTTAKGIASSQLLNNDLLYGYDPVQFYGDLYFPNIGEGTLLRFGRFILLPGIEADLAVDNYTFSHTILYTYFPYTHTGILATTKLNDQWQIQYGLTAGSDIAIWTSERELTPIVGVRWVSKDNNDSIYLCTITNSANFSYNNVQMVPDVVWTHRFTKEIHMLTEAYYCYQNNVPEFTSFGKDDVATTRSGTVKWYGVSNYFEVELCKKTYLTFRNEALRDEEGQRTGFATWYSTTTLGLVHKPNDVVIIRPELKFSHSYSANAYNQPTTYITGSKGPGTRDSQLELTCDVIFRF